MVVIGGYSTILASEKENNCVDRSSVTVFHKGEGTYNISYVTTVSQIDMLVEIEDTVQFGTGTNVTQCVPYSFDPVWIEVHGYSVPDKKKFEIGSSTVIKLPISNPVKLCYEVSGPKENVKIGDISCPK